MLFNSFEFIIYFVVVLVAYWSLPRRARLLFLLAASYFFYGSWDYRFLGLLILTTAVDFAAGLAIQATMDPLRRKLFLTASLGLNLTILGFFKYCNFFIDTLATLLEGAGVTVHMPTLNVILPVGISFYTFQSMSYTIDVYRKHLEPSRDFLTFATYVAFFPQLVAGPIERYDRLYPQLVRLPVPSVEQIRRGVFLVLQGYVRKVVIADGIAPTVDAAFNNIGAQNAGQLLEAAVLFTCQIYCDFAGYSEIARGVAYFFGIELMENFRTPFLSRSITEFWRRWHISLSQWLRDYLYIPLGGNRRGAARTYRNLIITMLLGGLWHGASWKFVVWGGLHGLLLAIERLLGVAERQHGAPPLSVRSLPRFLPAVVVTNLFVVLVFVFFRANSFDDAVAALSGMATRAHLGAALTSTVLLAVGTITALDLPAYLTNRQTWILEIPPSLRVAAYTGMLLGLILLSGNYAQPFIYFAF